MITGRLHNLLNVFRGGTLSPEDREELLEEVFVTVLGRAVSADTNINPTEVAAVQRLYEDRFGETIEASAVRSAANSELFETTPLVSYVKAAGKNLSTADKLLIVDSIKHVVRADERVGKWEIDFFNEIVTALNMTPAEIAGLVEEGGPA
jgi:uncharacterized tellurite resistance protein B-like protein